MSVKSKRAREMGKILEEEEREGMVTHKRKNDMSFYRISQENE